MNQEQAQKMIDEICEWLKTDAKDAVVDHVFESIQADIARGFCTDLLDAAGADDKGGCPLCQG